MSVVCLGQAMFRDIATVVAEKCVNPTNGRKYTVSTILGAMKVSAVDHTPVVGVSRYYRERAPYRFGATRTNPMSAGTNV